MRIVFATVFDKSNYEPIASHFDSSSIPFWSRSSVHELCLFACKQIAENSTVPLSTTVYNENYYCHLQQDEKIAVALITDSEYPSRVAFDLTNAISKNKNNLVDLFNRYQDPVNVDKILLIQKELAETKEILFQNIDKLLNRGESLHELVEKSENLSFQSKLFAKETKKLNRCCTLL